MRSRLESTIQKRARDLALDLLGVRSSKFEGASENGKPDVIFWLPAAWGGAALAEFKRPGEKARALQIAKHKEWRELGYHIGVFDNEYDCLEWLITILEGQEIPEASRKILVGASERLVASRSRARKNGRNSGGA